MVNKLKLWGKLKSMRSKAIWNASKNIYSNEELRKAQQAILCNQRDALQNTNYIIEYLEKPENNLT